MKRLFPLFMIWAAGAAQEGLVTFRNGDHLPGALLDMSAPGENREYRLRLSSDYLVKPVPLDPGSLDSINWEGDYERQTGNACINIVNGNRLPGQVTDLNEARIALCTKYMGDLDVPLADIATVVFNDASNIIYQGTNSLGNWNMPNNKLWEVRNDRFYTRDNNAIIARDIGLPSRIHLSVTFHHKSNFQNEIWLWGDKGDGTGNKYVGLLVANYRMAVGWNGQYTEIFNRDIQRKLQMPMKLDLFADRDKGKYLLYINGRELKQQRDVEEEEVDDAGNYMIPDGKDKFGGYIAIRLLQKGSGIDNFSVREWDGAYPGEMLPDGQQEGQPAELVEKDDGKGNSILLTNGDRLTGEVSFKNGQFTVKSPFYTVKVPVSRLRMLSLNHASPVSGTGAAEAPPQGLPCELATADGCVASCRIDRIEQERVYFTTAYSPELRSVPLDAVRSIRFDKGRDQRAAARREQTD